MFSYNIPKTDKTKLFKLMASFFQTQQTKILRNNRILKKKLLNNPVIYNPKTNTSKSWDMQVGLLLKKLFLQISASSWAYLIQGKYGFNKRTVNWKNAKDKKKNLWKNKIHCGVWRLTVDVPSRLCLKFRANIKEIGWE